MSNIVKFKPKAEENEDIVKIELPTKEEIAVLQILASNYKGDEMVDVNHWDGSCWEAMFNEMQKYAYKIGENVWDVMAVMIAKMRGTRFRQDKSGNWVIETPHESEEKETE